MRQAVPTRGMTTFKQVSTAKWGIVNGRKHAAFDLVVCRQPFMIAGIIMTGVADYFAVKPLSRYLAAPLAPA